MIIPGKRPIALFIALVAAGMAGNYFKFPIFLNIDFLFGSIFAMLIVQYFGLVPGMLAAALISGYTYFLWNHPYAIIIMTAEAAVVGLLMGRRKMGLVLADTLFWLIIGMPLVYLFYHVVMLVPLSNANIIMTKQAMNGIANALVARLIFTGFALRSRSSLMSYREIVYNLLAFFVLCPTLIILAISGRADFKETDLRIRTSLIQDSARVTSTLETWETDRKTTILNLAEMAAAKSPRQMQPHLEQAKKSDVNFLRIGLLNRDATITAYFPVLDELGQSSIGKNYADRPYLPMLKQTLKPMLSEVVMGKVGIPRPIVMMIVPVVIRGEYGGYVAGTLNLGQIQAYLDLSMSRHASFYTLLDKNDNVIMTNRADQAVMSPFVRGRGTVNPVEGGISQWVPALPSHTPPTERWRQSVYVAETPIGSLAAWKLVLEQPVAPFQQSLYDNYTGKLTLLFLIFLKIGAVLYGSGYVLLAFLRADFVTRLGWLTDRQLIDAIAIGQVTPGPVFTTATFIGYLLGGPASALLATLGIFLPSFIFVALSHPLIPRLRNSPWASSLLDGVNVASLGLMAAVTWQLGRAALVDPLTVTLALVSALLLFRFKVNSTWLVLGGAAVGILSRL